MLVQVFVTLYFVRVGGDMSGYVNFFEKFPALGEAWFRNNSTMMLISGPGGEIYDANNAFLDFIHYTLTEFTRLKNPVSWHHITPNADELAADQDEARRCMEGIIQSYRVRKHYVPKDALPHLVDLKISRYPLEGGKDSFEFFFVEIYDLRNSGEAIREELHELSKNTLKELKKLNHNLREARESESKRKTLDFGMLSDFAREHPKITWYIIILLSSLIVGRSTAEILEAFKKIVLPGLG